MSRPTGPGRRLAGLAVPALVAVLLALAAAAASFSTLEVGELEQPALGPPEQRPAVPPVIENLPTAPVAEPEPATGLDWIGDLVVVLWLALALVGLVLLLRLLARRRGRAARDAAAVGTLPEQVDEAPLLAAVDAGLEELSDDDQDPRRAVIACWLRLEESAEAVGVPHYEADTAGELVVRLLRSRQVSEPVLAGLADVYREARYATHAVDARMRTHARSALRRLRQELAASPPAMAAAAAPAAEVAAESAEAPGPEGTP